MLKWSVQCVRERKVNYAWIPAHRSLGNLRSVCALPGCSTALKVHQTAGNTSICLCVASQLELGKVSL